MPVIPDGGYAGKKDELGNAKSETYFRSWIDSLPKKWQTNPFHNHFIQVPIDATDEEIAAQADALLPKFYGQWSRGEKLGVSRGKH